MGEKEDAGVKHETYHDCQLPTTAEQGEKILCECGRLWRYDNGYFIVEGKNGMRAVANNE